MATDTTDEPLQCTRCGLTSVLRDQFHSIRSGHGTRERYCPVCWQKRESGLYAAMHWSMLVMGGIGAIVPAEGLRWSLIVLSLTHFASMVLILPHELSHALVGRALGFRIYKIQFGWHGRRWWRRRFGRVVVECRGTMDGGLVQAATRSRSWLRVRHILLSAAGPMVHLVLIGIILQLMTNVQFGVTALILWIGLLANGWDLFWSVLPKTHSIAGRPTPSDGLAIIGYLFASREAIRQFPLAYYWLEAEDRCERGDTMGALDVVQEAMKQFPEQPILAVWEGVCRLDLNEPLAAREIFLRERDLEEIPAEWRAIMINNVAWSDLVSRDPELIPESLDFSAQAYRALPWMPEIKGTRGSILMETGEVEAGMTLLQQALAENESLSNQSLNALFLARGLSRLGRKHEAVVMFERAKSLDPTCSLLRNGEWGIDLVVDQPRPVVAKNSELAS